MSGRFFGLLIYYYITLYCSILEYNILGQLDERQFQINIKLVLTDLAGVYWEDTSSGILGTLEITFADNGSDIQACLGVATGSSILKNPKLYGHAYERVSNDKWVDGGPCYECDEVTVGLGSWESCDIL